MELRHLRYFRTIAEELHVTRAAERLHIAQPALSAQMRALEADIGARLLHREGRGIQLTTAGEIFHQECIEILEHIDRARRRVAEAADGQSGKIKIGLIESATYSKLIAHALRLYRKRWPRVEMELMQRHSADLYQDLAAKKVDAAFLRPPAPFKADFEAHTLLREKLYVVVPRDHSWARRQSIPLNEIASEPLVVGTGGGRISPVELQLRQINATTGTPAAIVQRTPELSTAINLVSAGFGISIVPEGLCNVRRGEVVFVPLISEPRIRAEIAFVIRANESSPTVMHLRTLVLKAHRQKQ